MNANPQQPAHFKGKDAIGHVAEAHAKGILASTEIHGIEMGGSLSAAIDAAKEASIIFVILWTFFSHAALSFYSALLLLSIFTLSWALWKMGRSAWLGWSRLERLHRVLEQEKWEIEHNRSQERSELRVLYEAKGFEGKLLDDVIDVLMSDGDRLLRVMVEEEMGLSLQNVEHPLKQSLGAVLGMLIAYLVSAASLWLLPSYGIYLSAALVIGLTGVFSARMTENRMVPAIVWNLAIAALSLGTFYFLMEFFL